MAEILGQETWTTESLWTPLAAILNHSRAVHFLIVIYDFEGWPHEIRSWWSRLGSLGKTFCGSTLTFLASSRRLIHYLTPLPRHELNLEKEYDRYKKDIIRVKTNNLLDQVYGSVTLGKGLSYSVRKKIISAAERFQGSFTAINTYLVLLFQSFTLHTLDTIVSKIEASPQTEERLYELEIMALRTKPPRTLSWASSAVSWILWSMRPLQIEELRAIVAVNLSDSSVAKFRPRISIDMERDLRSHLGFVVAVENRYARIVSGVAREVLSRDNTRKLLDLQDHSGLASLCLHYITLILMDNKQETWKKCLSHVSWKHQTPDPRDPAMEFLDYACRFWPTHFLLVEEPDEILKRTVVQFLMIPQLGKRWFQLYLLCNSQSAIPLEKLMGVSQTEPKMPEKYGSVADRANIEPLSKAADTEQLAVHMASYVGLASVIPEILGTSDSARKPKMIDVRRGYSERAVAFLDSRSRYYLDCAICNDDESAVKEWLDSNREQAAKYLPLHKAARAGCLKTSQTLLHLLDKPAQTDQDGRTPLHLAAVGGSTKMIRFLLGMDDSDPRIRSKDVPNMTDVKDSKSQTPLIIASRLGNFEAAKLVLKSGADLAIRDSAGKTALDYAVLSCPEVVESFAARDAAHFRGDDEYKPLHIAASSGSVQTVSTLVSALNRSGGLVAAIEAQDDQGKTPLHHAAENGHAETVKILLKCEISTNKEDERYQRAAELAATNGHLATMKLLVSHSPKLKGDGLLVEASRAGQLLVVEYLLCNKLASPDDDPRSESRPLSAAASMGHNKVVRTLLRYKADVNIEDGARKTPLHHAAENGRYNVAQTLLRHQANVSALDIERRTPLHSAAKAGWVGVIKLFLKGHRADVNACSRDKETALHLAVKNPKAVEALLKAHADPTATDVFGHTPLHMATREKCLQSVNLLRKVTDINARDDEGRSLLCYAISLKDLTMVKALCTDQPGLRDSEDQMYPALKWAVDFAAFDVLDFLLNISSKSVNKVDKYGSSLIHIAARMESPEALALLLDSGADVNLQDSLKRTPLHNAAQAGRVQNMSKLIEQDAEVNMADKNDQTPLFKAILCDDIDAVAILLEAKVRVNIRDDQGRTPLYLAAYSGHVKAVQKFLNQNADVQQVDNKAWSPLHAAADNLEITRMLIEHGANINVQNDKAWTPLHLATSWSQSAVAKLLIEKDANPNQFSGDGNTALHLAITACDADLVQWMLNNGADFMIKTGDGLSCLSLAAGKDLHKTLEVLLGIERPSASGAIWNYEAMAAAYWTAIEQGCQKSLNVLVKKENRLLDEVSNDGFTGLETCLRNRTGKSEDERLAIGLLKLGAGPFKRRQADRKSAFELGILSRRKTKSAFMDACLERIPEDVSSAAPTLGFPELRIAIELDGPEFWKKLAPLRESASAMTDPDGWSLDHFVHQSARRMSVQLQDGVPLKRTRTPTGLVPVPMWLPPDIDTAALLEIAPNRLQVSFTCE